MSRRGNPCDNPQAESFMKTLKVEAVYLNEYETCEDVTADLPGFIDNLEAAGFSARRYAVWYQMELARPIFLMALVLVAAAFTMRHVRTTNTGASVLVAIMLGFSLHYIRNFAQVLGENGQIPVILAAWAPPVASLMLALGIVLHMEDG